MHKIQHEVFQLIDTSLYVSGCTWPSDFDPVLGGPVDMDERTAVRDRMNRKFARRSESPAGAVATRMKAIAAYPSKRSMPP
jgi:hypothetical protein